MALDVTALHIVHFPDPILRTKAAPVERVDATVRAVATRMIELMHEADGIGLAAPQVGLGWRMFVVSGRAFQEDEQAPPASDITLVNPVVRVIDRDMVSHEEGCLSLPGIKAEIRRPKGIELTATSLDDEPITIRDSGFLARVLQHEFDHLDGVLIIDRMSRIDRLASRRALKELQAAAGEGGGGEG